MLLESSASAVLVCQDLTDPCLQPDVTGSKSPAFLPETLEGGGHE